MCCCVLRTVGSMISLEEVQTMLFWGKYLHRKSECNHNEFPKSNSVAMLVAKYQYKHATSRIKIMNAWYRMNAYQSFPQFNFVIAIFANLRYSHVHICTVKLPLCCARECEIFFYLLQFSGNTRRDYQYSPFYSTMYTSLVRTSTSDNRTIDVPHVRPKCERKWSAKMNASILIAGTSVTMHIRLRGECSWLLLTFAFFTFFSSMQSLKKCSLSTFRTYFWMNWPIWWDESHAKRKHWIRMRNWNSFEFGWK